MFLRILMAAVLAAGLASAQGKKGGGGGGGGGAGGGGGMPRPQRVSRLDTIAEKLKLNKDQKDQVSKIFDASQEEAAPLRDQFDQGRRAITSALISGKTGDDLEKMMDQFTALEAMEAAVEAKAFAKVYALLEPKQQSKAANVFATEMAGMFMGRNWRMAAGGAPGGMGR